MITLGNKFTEQKTVWTWTYTLL